MAVCFCKSKRSPRPAEPPWEQSVLGFWRPPTLFCWAEGGLAAIRGSSLLAADSEPHLPLEGRRPGLLWEWRTWGGGGEVDPLAEEGGPGSLVQALHISLRCPCNVHLQVEKLRL